MSSKNLRGKSPVLLPARERILKQLGENISLARKRRKLTMEMVAQRADTTRLTVSNIEKGSPSVAIGHYMNVLATLNQENDLLKVAGDDELGRKLADIELMNKRVR
ncbi:helix-turn-helix domain-containing protein [uncultured Methylophaga sp.]|uniref:helix-turn-helix domain-containing protein n=1 Tax=uncultured Methylophaga sp. TaxID=285271 RepID=UPI00262021AA|nr:helix-turn-helix domain-containing protein [uncultured Methylophaga sp.]